MVSIIMPTYNRMDYLSRAIESVLGQTYKSIELIVVDDNANFPNVRQFTEELINSYDDPRIRLIKNETNIGGAASRNQGIFASKGDYITFLDDDDMYLPDKVKTQYEYMIENNCDFSVMDGATYDMDENKVSERNQKINNDMTKDELIKAHLIYHISGTNTFMYKAEFIKSLNGFDDVPSCHEYFLIDKTLERSTKIGYIPEIHIRNYMHKGEQLSTSIKKLEGQKLMIKAKKKHFDLLSKQEKKHVLSRHYGVLFFVNYKNKRYFKALYNMILSFLSSPKQSYTWFKEYKNKITA